VLPGGKVCYTHSRLDANYTQNSSYFVFHLFDLQSGLKEEYEIPFDPFPINGKEFGRNQTILFQDKIENIPDPKQLQLDSENRKNIINDHLKRSGIKHREPFSYIIFDRSIAYIYSHKVQKRKCLAQIVDLETGKIKRQVYMPAISAFSNVTVNYIIKNGYAYTFGVKKSVLPVIKKYRIDPSVYGK
jgi:hypothetical protein